MAQNQARPWALLGIIIFAPIIFLVHLDYIMTSDSDSYAWAHIASYAGAAIACVSLFLRADVARFTYVAAAILVPAPLQFPLFFPSALFLAAAYSEHTRHTVAHKNNN